MKNRKTCLYNKHVTLGAQMQPFAGFEMPILHLSIVKGRQAIRQHCGIFDISHMGEAYITGADVEQYVSHILTNDVADVPINRVFYGMILYPDSGTVDDLLVYKTDENEFFLVFNAASIDKGVAWMRGNTGGFSVTIDHCSDYYGQLAMQGPKTETVMREMLYLDYEDLQFYTVRTVDVDNKNVIISRTGYTDEDGFEIYGSHTHVINTWDALTASKRCVLCGFGCRDALRFEVGLSLYGDELSAEISPVMAGLSMFYKLDREEFVDKEAIVKQKEESVKQRVISLELQEKTIPRHGCTVLRDGKQIGVITTGYHAISVDKSVALALVSKPDAKLGTGLEIRICKETFRCVVAEKRLYNKHYKED